MIISIKKIKGYMNKENSRSKLMQINIAYNFGIKGLSVLLNLLIVSYTYNYLGSDTLFGIWSTILTFLTWITMIDMGLGNGLRNELIKELACENKRRAKVLISTAYFFMFLIVSLFILIFVLLNPYINWSNIFNINSVISDLNTAMYVIVLMGLINLFLNLIFSISNALQRGYYFGIYNLLSNSLMVISLIVMGRMDSEFKLLVVATIYSGANIIIAVIYNLYLFDRDYKDIKPSIKLINTDIGFKIVRDGLSFFALQLLTVIVMSFNNVIILRYLGASYVTEYQLAFKLFSIVIVISGIIFSPLWSAFRDAFIKKDYEWMRKVMVRNYFLYFFFVAISLVLIFLGNPILKLWISEKIFVSTNVLVLTSVFCLLVIWQSFHAYILNSMNKLKIQIYSFSIGLFIGIPTSIKLSSSMGTEGILIGSIIALSIFSLFAPYVIYKELKKLKLLKSSSLRL